MHAIKKNLPERVRNFSSHSFLLGAKFFYCILLLTSLLSLLLTPGLKAQDLIISKTGPSSANPGDIINYTITYQNVSGDFATNVEITDFLPTNLHGTFLSSNPAGTIAGNTISWTSVQIPNLAKLDKERYSIDVQFRVGLPDGSFSPAGFYIPSSPITLENSAQIKSSENLIPVQSNSVETWVTQYCGTVTLPALDGEIKSAGGSYLLRLIAITNTGNIYDQFEINLSEGAGPSESLLKQILDSNRNSISGVPATVATATTAWLAPGETAFFFIKLIVDQAPAQTHNYTDITLRSVVCNSLLQSATMNTLIHNPSDPLIYILKTGNPGTVKTGDTLYYTLYIYNNTNADIAKDVVLTETYPIGTTFLFANPMPDTNNDTWNFGDIGESGYKEVDIAVTIDANALCADKVITNTASATYSNNPGAPILSTASTLIETMPLAISTITSSNITCSGFSDGTVTVEASGVAPIEYDLFYSPVSGGPYIDAAENNGDLDGTYTGLPSGFYKVSITDNCPDPWIPVESIEVAVAEPLITLEASITAILDTLCVESNILTASVQDGVPPYSYVWSSSNGGLIVDPAAISLDYTPPIGFNGDIITLTVTDFCTTVSSDSETVSIIQTPTPSGNAIQTFCDGATVADLMAAGSGIQWYDAASDGNLLANTETLVDGKIYYATQTTNGCKSYVRMPVTVSINFVTGGTITDNQIVCPTDIPSPFIEVVPHTGIGALSYQWLFSLGGSTFTNIVVNGAMALYNPMGSPFEFNYYKRITTSTLNGVACSAESNILLITFDIRPPVWNSIVNDTTVECSDLLLIPVPTATDILDPNPVVSYTDISSQTSNGSCSDHTYSIIRKWHVVDNCGNAAVDKVQNINVVDNTAPTASNPPPINTDCIANAAPDINVITDEADNCTSNPKVAWVGDLSDGLINPETITRTYNVGDDCGHQTFVYQTIVVHDTIDPVITCPANISLNNDAGICGAVVTYSVISSDNCSGETIVQTSGLASGSNFPVGTTTNTFVASDASGNTTTCSFDVIVSDTEKPVIHNVPDDVIIECSDCLQSFENNDFEEPLIPSSQVYQSVLAPSVSGWETTAIDNRIEIQKSGGVDGVLSYSGNQHAELNGNNVGDLYQEFCTVPTTTVQISFAHHKRMAAINTSPDIMQVLSGPDLAHLNSLGLFTATSASGWTVHTVDFNIPLGQNSTVFVFRAVQGAPSNPTYGNLIDDINVITLFDAANIPFATDNCAVESFSLYEEKIDGSCLNDYRINRTWTAVDVAGNVTNATQSVIVGDIKGPDFTVPPDITISCTDNPTDLTITGNISNLIDNCDSDPISSAYSDSISTGICPTNYTITRTWTAVDHCLNATSKTQIITVEDSTPPTATNPAPLIAQCASGVPAPDITAVMNVTDNCSTNPTVVWVSDGSDGLSCPETITRTYSLSDDCGNSSNITQIITINDTTKPSASNPLPLSFECFGEVPPADIAVVADEADNCTTNPTVVWVSDVSDGLSCPETITRSYSVTDDCGNTIDVYQTITIDDDILPTASNPLPLNVECIGDAVVDIQVVTDEADNCGIPTVAFVSDVSNGLSCPEIITRTYSVTDDCGNRIDVNQTITVHDITFPTASNPPALTVDCIDNLPVADVLVVTDEADNCTTNPVVAFVSDVSDNASCPETITRTYSVSDDCGNTIHVYQTITVNDDVLPTASNPASISVFCYEDAPIVDVLIVTDEADNCTTNPIVEHLSDAPSGPICALTIVRTYRVSDQCGNYIDLTQNILVQDTIAPTASNPPDILLQCLNDAAVDISVVTDEADNCTVNPLVEHISDVDKGGSGCVGDPLILTRTYRVSDNCGNHIDLTQNILVQDDIAPTVSEPVDVIIETCSSNDIINPAVGTSNLAYSTTAVAINITQLNEEGITTSDNCSIASITYIDVSNGNTCPEVITRTFTIIDNCGNTASTDYTITLEDKTKPVISEPKDIVIEACSSTYKSNPMAGTSNLAYSTIAVAISITQLNEEGITASDNCSIASITYIDEKNGANCQEVITRTFTIIDNCGNTASADYTITLEDKTKPVVSELNDVTIEACSSSNRSDLIAGISGLTYSTTSVSINITQLNDEGIAASDNCHIASITYKDSTNGASCPELITRTFEVTDDCGNTTSVDYTITIRDTSPPTASNLPDLYVQCYEEALINPELVTDESDNCITFPQVEFFSDTTDGLSCPETFTRTYRITDNCDNSIFVTQKIIVLDTTKPTASNPKPIILESVDEIPLPDIAVVNDAADNCAGRPIVKFVSEVTDTLPLVRTITRKYSVSDYCGNMIYVLQNILINGFPYAVDDQYTIDENSKGNVFKVLENDNFGGDGPGNPKIEIVSQPEQGEVFLSTNPVNPADEFIVYTPPCNYYDKDSFEYAITDRSGDHSRATVYIDFIPNPLFIPEGFSPNGDGFNDCFHILGLFYYPLNSIVIFDQNGNRVFEDKPYKNNWDGRDMFTGNLLPQDTYFYLFNTGNSANKIRGFVYLIRKY